MPKDLSMVPTLKYYGNISVYRTLATAYIDGSSFSEFSQMNSSMREACRKRELHSCKVLHGDLEPWNFIIQTLKPKGTVIYF